MKDTIKNNGAAEDNRAALLLPYEAATRLRIHPETFRRWLREGKVKTRLKVGRGWRIPASELARLEREALMPEHQP